MPGYLSLEQKRARFREDLTPVPQTAECRETAACALPVRGSRVAGRVLIVCLLWFMEDALGIRTGDRRTPPWVSLQRLRCLGPHRSAYAGCYP